MHRAYLLRAASGVDDLTFVEAVEARQARWLDEWHFLNQGAPPPVDVYHLTAKGGVVGSQLLKRPPPSSVAASKAGVSLIAGARGLRGLGRAGRVGRKARKGGLGK